MFTAITKFARLRIIITCFALAFLGSVVGGGITEKFFLVLMLIATWIVHANSINDFADHEIDLVNLKHAKDRPLVTYDISLKQFWIIHGGSTIVMFLVASLFGFHGLLLTAVVAFGDYIYSLKPLRVTNMTFVSPLLLALAYTYFSFSFGFWSAGGSSEYPWMLTFGLFLAFLARLLLKDFRDIKGDKKFGKHTFLLRFGAKTTCVVSGIFWLLAVIVVSAATGFAVGVIIPLIIGLLEVVFWLKILAKAKHPNLQQKLIVFIANAANSTILVLLVYFIVPPFIPVTVGIILLSLNWFQYMRFKKQFSL